MEMGRLKEEMPTSALQCRRWPPTFRSPEDRARKQLSSSVGVHAMQASCHGLGERPDYLQGFRGSLVCLLWAPGRAESFWTAMPWEVRQGVGADPRGRGRCKALSGTSQAPRRARKRAEGTASSNVFSMFDQSQIQEFKEVGLLSHGAVVRILGMHASCSRSWAEAQSSVSGG